jgi:hypothetical protein
MTQATDRDIQDLKTAIDAVAKATEANTKAMPDLAQEMRWGFAKIESEMKTGFAELRGEIKAVDTKLDQRTKAIEIKLEVKN